VKEWLAERESAIGNLSNASGAGTAISAAVAQALSDTKYDTTSFANTLAHIQKVVLAGEGLECI
jgi:hypothetical protein